MPGQPIAMFMAVESVRRGLHEPPREPRPRRSRRVVAQVLQTVAHRLDPCVAQAPRTAAG
jgi:hypothetical protein